MYTKGIYLDHSATTPLDKAVLAAMKPYLTRYYGNPSSIHRYGQKALSGVDRAREQLAEHFNVRGEGVIFTSGATEADNLALKGLIKACGLKKPHIITSIVEHDAVLEPCMELEKEGAEITYVGVDGHGVVKTDELIGAIKDNTVLVSVMHANSEVGAVMPVRRIGKAIHKINEKRERDWNKLGPGDRGGRPPKIYFHTDATQAVNSENCDMEWNYVDMLSMSGHKIYGPKGVGALLLRGRVPLEALQRGGHHERNLRSGTLNVPGIVGLGCAVSRITKESQKENNSKISRLRDMLADGILTGITNTVLNTKRRISTPGHAHFSFLGVEGESVLMALDMKKIAVSTGSACASGSLKASHVLIAMGIKKEVAHYSIRFTLGKYNTEEQIKNVLRVLPPVIGKFRKMNPLYNN